jgi:hypothetical protein
MIERRQPLLGQLADRVSSPGRAVLIVGAVLFVWGAFSLGFSQGTTVVVTTTAPEAVVRLDGAAGTSLSPTSWRFERVPFGDRQVVATHRDFLTRTTELDVGIFGDRDLMLEMERRKIRLTLNTVPGAEVFLNGQSYGNADQAGVFVNAEVPAGDYQIAIRQTGYEDRGFPAQLHESVESLRVMLDMTAEKRAEISRQREQAFELLLQADTQYGRRLYQSALDSVQESIRINPEDSRAHRLRERIVETMKILQ